MLTDDLPWPELGNVSRGATRGNQGQKGILGPPDAEGRCVLQLRVQPGVLAVRLNRKASDWYRLLDGEVNRALKLTKTYWRKARRRQDYDARADQDHMELHEWLQQLKDKVMSHLELLMQKGEIQGPPYLMADHLELTFLRKFIERQAAGIPHNPRLRRNYIHTATAVSNLQTFQGQGEASTSHNQPVAVWDEGDRIDHDQGSTISTEPVDGDNMRSLLNDMETSRVALAKARAELTRAQRETQEAFRRYTACLEEEQQARQRVTGIEEKLDIFSMSAL
ncbi:uncharacterized protein LAESUDRAFT_654077 [Laetiporus sulphureus 93-53]|uniref:Uncharacterized protein n=1 Tax=Laetiporus sulphureus 93-53 TaxID=1314785 RepID=A0A165E1S9_9APHY|nr:uncharacterized protein LAESUDRAFT_654077 [Laetiporus sulphureus 93-53]KZT06080.1 hypothetical protein LAESUDRAFT_654077 [Laetiporus sulphureus 93-53]